MRHQTMLGIGMALMGSLCFAANAHAQTCPNGSFTCNGSTDALAVTNNGSGDGVLGTSAAGNGIHGSSGSTNGTGNGVQGNSTDAFASGVFGENTNGGVGVGGSVSGGNGSSYNTAILGIGGGTGYAGLFEGAVNITDAGGTGLSVTGTVNITNAGGVGIAVTGLSIFKGVATAQGINPQTSDTYSVGTSTELWTAVYAKNGTIQTSDARMKKDIEALRYGLHDVLKLRPVTFKWKSGADTNTHFGVIAQEIEKVIPNVVTHGANPEDLLGLNYSELIPVLIKSVQELKAENNDLSERLKSVEKNGGHGIATSGVGEGAVGLAGLAMMVGAIFMLRRKHLGA